MEIRYKYRFNFFRFINEVFIIALSYALTFSILNLIKSSKSDFVLLDLWMLPLLIIGWYFSSRSTKASDDLNSKTIIGGLSKMANSIFIQFCLVILFFFTAHQTFNTKRFLFIYIALLGIFIPLEKVFYRKIMHFLQKSGVNKKKILIIGAGKTGMEFSDVVTENEHLGYEIFGFLDDAEKPNLNGKYLGKINKLEEYMSEDAPFDEVLVALPNSAHNKIKYIANIVGNHTIKLRIIPAYHELINSQYSVSIFNGFPMITNRHVPLDDVNLRTLKRTFDIVFSFLF